jgi:23S rRNA-/tRNA-specific pseudouridylate synthase
VRRICFKSKRLHCGEDPSVKRAHAKTVTCKVFGNLTAGGHRLDGRTSGVLTYARTGDYLDYLETSGKSDSIENEQKNRKSGKVSGEIK